MLSTNLPQAKDRAISHVRCKIEELGRQCDWSKISDAKAGAQASLTTILNAGLVTSDEFEALAAEIESARDIAAAVARRRTDELDAADNLRWANANRVYWAEGAAKLRAELTAAGIELSAADDVIAANAGGWFAAMSANEKSSVIATMRNLASA